MNPAPVNRSSPSFKSAWGALIAAIAIEIVSRVITGVMANSAHSQSLGNYINSMNQIVMMQGIIDVIAVVLVLVSVVLFILAFIRRSKAAKKE